MKHLILPYFIFTLISTSFGKSAKETITYKQVHTLGIGQAAKYPPLKVLIVEEVQPKAPSLELICNQCPQKKN